MGTDYVRLFNKKLADAILAMDVGSLTQFLEDNIGTLRSKRLNYSPIVFDLETEGGSIADSLGRLLSTDYTLTGLKTEIALDFAFGDEEIYLDYWGCYAENLADDLDGAISCLDFLPDEEEEHFILLRPKHVDRMLRSLREHSGELRVMDKEDVEKLARWRDFCAANPDYMIAYQIDF
jgi:hypothetical protein